VEGDIRDAKLVREVMEGVDIVFHEAAIRITQCAEDPRLAHDVLATGTFSILEATVAAKVKRVVYASSASIYGIKPGSAYFKEQRGTWETHSGDG
jgi:UDP-glucose 4-epimerase